MKKRRIRSRIGEPRDDLPESTPNPVPAYTYMEPLYRRRANYEKDDSTPGWQYQFLRDPTPFIKTGTTRKSVDFGGERINVTSLPTMVYKAAKQRNLPVSGYVRRAVVAFICHDLDVTWGEAMNGIQKPMKAGEFESGGFTRDNGPDEGQDRGPWKIDGLTEVPEEEGHHE